MRNPERIGPIMRTLEAFWMLHPDLRFAQVLHILYGRANGADADGLNVPFYEEESAFSQRLAAAVRDVG